MIMKIFNILLMICLLLYANTDHVYAAGLLTLEECLALALKNNESIRAGSSDIEVYRQKAIMSRADMLPGISADFRYRLIDKEPSFIIEKDAFITGIPPSATELPAGDEDAYAFTLTIEQPVYTGGYLTGTHEKALLNEKSSETNYQKVERETIMKVKSAYYDLLKTLKTKEVQEQILKHKEERRRVTAELLKEGISKNEDILLADAETSDQRLALFKTENDINIRRRALNNLIYAGPDTQTEVADRLENKKLNAGLSESKDLAIRSRMDLASFNYELKSAQKEIDIAKSSFYPKSSITGSYTRQKETPLSYPDVWALMFNVKWDIFNWGKTRSDVNRAVAVSEKLKNEYDALIKNILLEVEDKWYRVKEAEARVEANKDRFIYAQEHHKNEGLKLSEGVIKQAEFLGAETDLVRSRNEYIISIYDLNIALAEFEFAISSDLDPFVQTEKIEALNTQVLNVGKNRRLSGEMNFDSDRPDGSGLIQISNEAKKAETLDQGATISEQKDPADGAAVRAEPVKEGRYIVQVASFRSNDLADDVLRNLKNDFPEALIIKAGNFNKVRITGISTREEGLHLINELENKFKVKPLLVRSN